MRSECPVCGGDPIKIAWNMDFLVPDGWTLPNHNEVKGCSNCGMIWYDNDRTQADYDTYYKERYGFGLESPESYRRQDSFCDCAANWEPDKSALIVDLGGGDGYITNRLVDLGYYRAVNVEVGGELPDNVELLLLCHVLEHIYDLQATMSKIVSAMAPYSKILIEVPDAAAMPMAFHLPMLDYHQKHINHFTPKALDTLLSCNGYLRVSSMQFKIEHHGVYVYRALYALNRVESVYARSWEHFFSSTISMKDTLIKIKHPVIVWGCGDLAMHLLAQVKLNIVHYVDLDPHYRGATIGGVPVLDHVVGNNPILIMAVGQKDSILKSIKDAGLTNEVICV